MMMIKVHQVRMRIRSSNENDDEDDVLQVCVLWGGFEWVYGSGWVRFFEGYE